MDKNIMVPFTESISKQDLEITLKIHEKVIEVQSVVADQNEEIIKLLGSIKEMSDKDKDKLDKLVKQSEETSRDLFQVKILFLTGLLSIVVQIVQIFLKK